MTKELEEHEVYQLALDAVPMFLALVALNVLHPGKVLAGEDSKFAKKTRQQKKEEKAARKAEKNGRSVNSSDGVSYV